MHNDLHHNVLVPRNESVAMVQHSLRLISKTDKLGLKNC
jgi:hypothetical protein